MLLEIVVRFVLGGVLVSLFAVIGCLFKPKTFSGIFAAAPSVGLATLAITFAKHGASYVAVEGRSMIGGAVAMALYSLSAAAVLVHRRVPPWRAAILLWGVWLAVALLAWAWFEA
ncbi:Hypothetical protein A7982_09403 [Minicystis rosea]|nr:Hypothetical protein A7982_09403 [Minicystis rosea]